MNYGNTHYRIVPLYGKDKPPRAQCGQRGVGEARLKTNVKQVTCLRCLYNIGEVRRPPRR